MEKHTNNQTPQKIYTDKAKEQDRLITLVDDMSKQFLGYIYNYAQPKDINPDLVILAVAKVLGEMLATSTCLTRDQVIGCVDACLKDTTQFLNQVSQL